jgi:hypothetical protein
VRTGGKGWKRTSAEGVDQTSPARTRLSKEARLTRHAEQAPAKPSTDIAKRADRRGMGLKSGASHSGDSSHVQFCGPLGAHATGLRIRRRPKKGERRFS